MFVPSSLKSKSSTYICLPLSTVIVAFLKLKLMSYLVFGLSRCKFLTLGERTSIILENLADVSSIMGLKSLILFVPAYPFKVEAAELALFRIMHHHDLTLLTLHAIQPFQDHY